MGAWGLPFPRSAERLMDGSDVEATLDTLLRPKSEYLDQRTVIFAGFCAWVLAPMNRSIIRDAILIKADQRKRSMLKKAGSEVLKGTNAISYTDQEIAVRRDKALRPFLRKYLRSAL